MSTRISPLRDFLGRESTSGVIVLVAAGLGLITANSPLSERYFWVLDFDFAVGSGWFLLDFSILKIINYLLMSIFFFVVGLEIKRELTTGHLATLKKAMLPLLPLLGEWLFLLLFIWRLQDRSHRAVGVCQLQLISL